MRRESRGCQWAPFVPQVPSLLWFRRSIHRNSPMPRPPQWSKVPGGPPSGSTLRLVSPGKTFVTSHSSVTGTLHHLPRDGQRSSRRLVPNPPGRRRVAPEPLFGWRRVHLGVPRGGCGGPRGVPLQPRGPRDGRTRRTSQRGGDRRGPRGSRKKTLEPESRRVKDRWKGVGFGFRPTQETRLRVRRTGTVCETGVDRASKVVGGRS